MPSVEHLTDTQIALVVDFLKAGFAALDEHDKASQDIKTGDEELDEFFEQADAAIVWFHKPVGWTREEFANELATALHIFFKDDPQYDNEFSRLIETIKHELIYGR